MPSVALAAAPTPLALAQGSHADSFLLAGQSNLEGKGRLEHRRALAEAIDAFRLLEDAAR